MKYKILTFGIASDILGGKEVTLDINGSTVGDLRLHLSEKYPALNDLRSLFIAINREYAEDTLILSATDEIAVIPPVSGG